MTTQHITLSARGFMTIGTGLLAACLLPAGGPRARAESPRQALRLSDFEIRSPTPAVPWYHFSVRLDLPKTGPVRIEELTVNEKPLRNFYLLAEDESLEPDRPRERRRMVIAQGLKSPRPERRFAHPTLIGRLDWHNGASYELEIALGLSGVDGGTLRAKAKAAAPAVGGYWNAAWKHYQSVVVSETAGLRRTREPVETTLLFYPDTLVDPAREIRVVAFDRHRRRHVVVPSQVTDVATVGDQEPPSYNQAGKRKPATCRPTRSATITFLADAQAHESGVYLVFHGNPDAPAPSRSTDLTVTGAAPGVVVENAVYRLKLHDASGMLDEVTLKAKPDETFVHKKETNGAIQWNPGCYAPPRPWAHLSDWQPGKYDYQYKDVRGPIVFRTRRWGQMPMMPELVCSMEYQFYAGAPYFVMRSSIHVRHDVAVLALRNAEVVFAREAFSEAAWWDGSTGKVQTRPIVSMPDLTEWTMADDTPWIAFFDRPKGCGYAGIQMQYANGGLKGRLRTLNPYLYVTTGPWIYWTRALAYPYGGHNPQQLIKIHAGSVFLEQWAYLPFALPAQGEAMFQEVEAWRQRLTQPLRVTVEDPIDPRMEVPEELYIEPGATGWEGKTDVQQGAPSKG